MAAWRVTWCSYTETMPPAQPEAVAQQVTEQPGEAANDASAEQYFDDSELSNVKGPTAGADIKNSLLMVVLILLTAQNTASASAICSCTAE